MSTRFYAGQKDYIVQLNLLDDKFDTTLAGSTIGITNDVATNAAFFVTFVGTNSGANTVKVASTKLTFNPSTGVLTATGFSGPLTGNSSTATALQTPRAINGVNFDGTAPITITANNPNAMTINNGGAGAASGSTYNGSAALTVSYNTVGAPSTTGTNASGTWAISVTGNAATSTQVAVTDDVTTNAAFFVSFFSASSGNVANKVSSTKLTFNPSTGVLTATGFAGPLTGNVTGNVTGTSANVTGIVAGANGGTGVNNSGKTITLGGNLTTSGANAVTLTTTAATNVTLPTTGTLATQDNLPAFRNRIINGDMRIDQRNNGGAVTPASSAYVVDRWQVLISQASKLTVQRNLFGFAPPAEATAYLGISVASAYMALSGETFVLRQSIEGFNVADLKWGTASAKSVTLTFWVTSTLSGTFSGALGNNGGSRSYPFTFAISAANTWESKTVVIPGDVAGTWATDNSTGVNLSFDIGSGSSLRGTAGSWAAANYVGATGAVSPINTASAAIHFTNVQFEVGSVGTPFERREYSDELRRCQRYYEIMRCLVGTTALAFQYNWKATKRAIPTLVSVIFDTGTGGSFNALGGSGSVPFSGCESIYLATAHSSIATATLAGACEL